jgi:hypothetical protein
MAYRPTWFEVDKTLLDMALEIHMGNTGSSDIDLVSYNKYRKCLKYALQNWKPTIGEQWEPFDNAVAHLCQAALREEIPCWLKKKGQV